MRALGQFVYNLIAGTAVHLISMIFGLIGTMILFGKMDDGPIYLLTAAIVPYFAAGAFLAFRKIRWPKLVSIISGSVALIFPPIIIAAYQDWNWSAIGSNYWLAAIAIPFSLFGCVCVQNKQQSNSNDRDSSATYSNDKIVG